jgi:ubiquinone/menaquinone biosynthesis C-methylase UbiE
VKNLHRKELSHAAPETEGITIRWAALYDPVVALLSRLSGRKRGLEKATLELAGLAAGEKVLDVGCGTGTLALAVQGQVGPEGEVHGIDAAPEMVAVARRKAVKAGVDLDFRGSDRGHPFPR